MNSSTLPYWLSLMVLMAASYGGWKWYQVKQFEESRAAGGIEFAGPPLEEFELTERSGEPFRSADMEGKVWVITLFFANCPGSCPRLNGSVKEFHNMEDLQDVTWVSITVDPQNDTLDVLKEYADRFQADPERWLFCRGELDYIKRIGNDFLKLPVSWKGHTDYAVVIDKQGETRGIYDIVKLSEHRRIRELLLELLSESATQDEPKTEPIQTEDQAESVAA